MKPENIIPSERSLERKVTYYMTPFIGNAQHVQIHRDRKQITQIHSDRKVLGRWEVEGSGVTASGQQVSFRGDENVLEH